MDFGGGRTMHVRTMEATDDGDVVEEVVIVKTDIAAPKATAFTKVTNALGVLTQVLNARDLDDEVNADNIGDANDDWTALAVNQEMPAVLALVKSAAFVPGEEGTQTVHTFAYAQLDGDEDTIGAQPVKAYETAGTYNGAMGTYRCNTGTRPGMVRRSLCIAAGRAAGRNAGGFLHSSPFFLSVWPRSWRTGRKTRHHWAPACRTGRTSRRPAARHIVPAPCHAVPRGTVRTPCRLQWVDVCRSACTCARPAAPCRAACSCRAQTRGTVPGLCRRKECRPPWP